MSDEGFPSSSGATTTVTTPTTTATFTLTTEEDDLMPPEDFEQDCTLFHRSIQRAGESQTTAVPTTAYYMEYRAHPLEIARNLWDLYECKPVWQQRLIQYEGFIEVRGVSHITILYYFSFSHLTCIYPYPVGNITT